MRLNHPSSTSLTLLGRLAHTPFDQDAWNQFAKRYSPKIFNWCLKRHVQETYAQEVTQLVLVKLLHKLQTFSYDRSKSFRGWLRTVTEHALFDYLDTVNRPDRATGNTKMLSLLDSVESRSDLIDHLSEEFDYELLNEAMLRVRLRVQPATWEIFRLIAMEGLAGAEVARRLNVKVATVFVAKSKVVRMLKEEIDKLETPMRPSHLSSSHSGPHLC